MEKILRKRPPFTEYLEGIKRHDKIITAQAITLVESQLQTDIDLAEKIVEAILPLTGNSLRIGITGSPGVGKSTFIEAFGKYLTSLNKKVAVLAVDPSSTISKGSILGDKTRMEELAKDALAFIRPTATGNTLGGVADRTREAILLCEAAGFEIIIIETVGVGQSETEVRNMIDFFLLLMLAGSGDELQGIKKGIMEMADSLIITKADGDNIERAKQAQADFQNALHLFQESESGWSPKVLIASALEKKGISEAWSMLCEYQEKTNQTHFFQHNRQQQNLKWFNECVNQGWKNLLLADAELAELRKQIEHDLLANKITPVQAAKNILSQIKNNR